MSYSIDGYYIMKTNLYENFVNTSFTNKEAIKFFKNLPSTITPEQANSLTTSNIDAINKNNYTYTQKYFILYLANSPNFNYAMKLIGDIALFNVLINAQNSTPSPNSTPTLSLDNSIYYNILNKLSSEQINSLWTNNFPSVDVDITKLNKLRNLIAINFFNFLPSKITPVQANLLTTSNIDAINNYFGIKYFILYLANSPNFNYAMNLIGDTALFNVLINVQNGDPSFTNFTIDILKKLSPTQINYIMTFDFPSSDMQYLIKLRNLITQGLITQGSITNEQAIDFFKYSPTSITIEQANQLTVNNINAIYNAWSGKYFILYLANSLNLYYAMNLIGDTTLYLTLIYAQLNSTSGSLQEKNTIDILKKLSPTQINYIMTNNFSFTDNDNILNLNNLRNLIKKYILYI